MFNLVSKRRFSGPTATTAAGADMTAPSALLLRKQLAGENFLDPLTCPHQEKSSEFRGMERKASRRLRPALTGFSSPSFTLHEHGTDPRERVWEVRTDLSPRARSCQTGRSVHV